MQMKGHSIALIVRKLPRRRIKAGFSCAPRSGAGDHWQFSAFEARGSDACTKRVQIPSRQLVEHSTRAGDDLGRIKGFLSRVLDLAPDKSERGPNRWQG